VKRHRRLIVVTVALVVALACTSCASKKSSSASSGDVDYAVRTAITDSLARDLSMRSGEAVMIKSVKSGAVPLDAGLDTLVDNNKALMSLIGTVSRGSSLKNAELAAAREAMAGYLRDRVHQLEASLVAMSPQDLETMYARGSGTPDAELAKVIKLMLEYDPGLKSTIPAQ
jgi:hypothetical protein